MGFGDNATAYHCYYALEADCPEADGILAVLEPLILRDRKDASLFLTRVALSVLYEGRDNWEEEEDLADLPEDLDMRGKWLQGDVSDADWLSLPAERVYFYYEAE